MKYMYKGKEVDESDFADIIYEQMTDDKYEDYLNEYPLIEIFGLDYAVGTLLRRADYERFREFRFADCEYLSREAATDEDVANEYGIEWVEENEEDE